MSSSIKRIRFSSNLVHFMNTVVKRGRMHSELHCIPKMNGN